MFHKTFPGIDFSSHWKLVCPFISLQKSSFLRLVSRDAAKTKRVQCEAWPGLAVFDPSSFAIISGPLLGPDLVSAAGV